MQIAYEKMQRDLFHSLRVFPSACEVVPRSQAAKGAFLVLEYPRIMACAGVANVVFAKPHQMGYQIEAQDAVEVVSLFAIESEVPVNFGKLRGVEMSEICAPPSPLSSKVV